VATCPGFDKRTLVVTTKATSKAWKGSDW